jgi:hypothetical protein
MIPEILLLIEQIGPRTTQIDDLRTSVSVLLQSRAFEAVESVGDALPSAHDAFVLVVAEGAFVANPNECGRAHVGIAHGALPVAFIAESADGDAGRLAAHDEISARGR